jgi:tetratricopeptide (TPR) repeat protein
MSRDNLFLGVGAGNWKINNAKYGNEYPGVTNTGIAATGERFFLRPHNDFLWVLSETGVIGFGLYATIFIMSLYYAYKSGNMAMFFGILCVIGFAFFSFPKERVFPSFILLVMIALVIPTRKVICLSPQLIFSTGVSVSVLLICITALYTVRYKTETMICKLLTAKSQKNWQEVINTIDYGYSKYSTIDPILATPIIFYRAEAHLYLKNFRQSFEDFKRAYQLNPYHIYVISNLATCYYINGFTKEAIEYYEKALEICPSFSVASNNLNKLKEKLKGVKL